MKYEYTQNRELSWLRFNERVLEEACNKNNPLFERLKFIEIFNSNLDEFFMIRVGSLTELDRLDEKVYDSKTGLSTKEQLSLIKDRVHSLIEKYETILNDLILDFKENNIIFTNYKDLSLDEAKTIKHYFKNDILPIISPQILDVSHPFPLLENKRLYLIVRLTNKNKTLFGIVLLPNNVKQFYKLDNKILFLEELFKNFASVIFKGYKVVSKNIIFITRNSDLAIDDMDESDYTDYRDLMKQALKKRTRLMPVRIVSNDTIDDLTLKYLLDKLNLKDIDCYKVKGLLDLRLTYSLIDEYKNKFTYPKLIHKNNNYIDIKKPLINQILKKDVLLFYPFDDMALFLKLIKEAAFDKSVISIKITIYRLSNKSKLVEYLSLAAENGKDVTILIELRARFDEQNNIDFSKRLEDAGCKVIYGFEQYKVHSKICLITRMTLNKVSYITQIGTGNYNEKTVNIYTDYSYITSKKEIGLDAINFFQNMLLGSLEDNYKYLLVSPNGLKNKVINMINYEASLGSDGYIFLKLNSITDIDVINALVEASKANVKIDMVVRGICCILPNVKGYTDNINIKSIVGRFLEHSRIYLFGKKDPKVYISSADLMTRNTQRRVEIASPILSSSIKNEIIEHIKVLLNDTVSGRSLNKDGKYDVILGDEVSSQEVFLNNNINTKLKDIKSNISIRKCFIKILAKNKIKYSSNIKVKLNDEDISFDYGIDNTLFKVINLKNNNLSIRFIEKWFYITNNLKSNKIILLFNMNNNHNIETTLKRINIDSYFINTIDLIIDILK